MKRKPATEFKINADGSTTLFQKYSVSSCTGRVINNIFRVEQGDTQDRL